MAAACFTLPASLGLASTCYHEPAPYDQKGCLFVQASYPIALTSNGKVNQLERPWATQSDTSAVQEVMSEVVVQVEEVERLYALAA